MIEEQRTDTIKYWGFDGKPTVPPEKVPVETLIDGVKGKGYELTMLREGHSYIDKSTVVVIPTRGMISFRVVDSITRLMAPQNSPRAMFIIKGEEVGVAYNEAIKAILADSRVNFKYLLTLEDDMIFNPRIQLDLINAIEQSGFDAVQALYWAKGEGSFPMALGDPSCGQFECKPRDIKEAMQKKQMVEVNAVAMGATIFKMSLFREIEQPWFKTWQRNDEKGSGGETQDCFFSRKLRERGRRLGVHCGILCGHLDVTTGEVW